MNRLQLRFGRALSRLQANEKAEDTDGGDGLYIAPEMFDQSLANAVEIRLTLPADLSTGFQEGKRSRASDVFSLGYAVNSHYFIFMTGVLVS